MLSVMAKGFFSSSPLLFYPIMALFLFMFVFAVITLRALRTKREELQTMAALPLQADCEQTNEST